MSQLVVLEQLKPLEVFTTKGVDDVLDRITREARSHLLDISTPDGRKQIASLAYKIAKSKTYLDEMGKDLVAEQKKQLALVDAERKRIRDTLDGLKEEIRAPLTEWENREEARVRAHETALAAIPESASYGQTETATTLAARLGFLQEYPARDWQEFEARATAALDAEIARTIKLHDAATKREAEQAELERMRREKEEREQRERDERIAAEAAAKAKAEAEEKARKEAEAEAAKVKAEREAAAAREAAIQREKEEAERQKAGAEARAKRAEEDRLAAVAKAQADRKSAEEKTEADRKAAAEQAQRDADAAARREREKIEAEKKAEADAAAKREADKAHRGKINSEALAAFLAAGLSPESSKAAVGAIAKGLIPHVTISY